MKNKLKILIFFAVNENTKKLSYNDDWLDSFINHPLLNVKACDLKSKKWIFVLPFINNFDFIVFLHSTNSNNIFINDILKKKLFNRKNKIIFFVGNEYKLMPDKISLLKEIKADYIVSQLPQDTAEWLYNECKNSVIISVPHALNPDIFKPKIPLKDRKIDIGVRAYKYVMYLGDKERIDLFNFFMNDKRLMNLNKDVSFNIKDRFTRVEWAKFLNSCKATISTEAGSSFLERDDHTRLVVNKYMIENPEASFEDVYRKFFLNYKNPVSGKCISSRHFDAIGTKTCQIMFPGRFNDILKVDKHYIALKHDFSNIKDVLEHLKDLSYIKKMVDETYEYALDAHTHKHRINDLLNKVL